MFDLDADDAVGLPLESIAPGVGPITPTPDSRELTLLARNSSGSEFPAALTVRAGVDGDDGLWHVFIRDLTESERLGKELDRAAEELRRREQARDEARTELRGTARELERATRRIDDLTAQLDDRDADLGDRDAELRELRRVLAAANGELDRAKRDSETARRSLAGAKRDGEATRRELAGAKRDAETARREVAGVGSARDHARAEADRNAREADRLRADLARATGELSRIRAELSAAAADLSSARAGGRALEEKLERTRADHAATARQLEADRAQLDAELHRVGAEHSRSLRALDEATAALTAAEDERALVAKHGSELIARYDERGVCLAASAGARGLLGYEPAELVGRPGADLIHPEDRARLLRARAGQAETTFRARLRRRDGEYVTVEVGFRPAEGQAGRLGEVTTIARPVAERRADDDAGRVAETRFRSLFGTLPGASALVGQDGRITRANPALARLTGYSADQLEGTALGTLVDDANAPVVAGRLRQVATGQVATLRMEHQLAHASGRTVAVELRVTPLPPADEAGDGRLHELVVHFQDLSEQRTLAGRVARARTAWKRPAATARARRSSSAARRACPRGC